MGMNHPVLSYRKKVHGGKSDLRRAVMHFLEDSCRCCYISSSFSCLGLMSEGLLYILNDVPDNPASGMYPSCELGHLLHEYIGTVAEKRRYHLLSGRCRVSCWIDLTYQFMLESLDVLLSQEQSQAATFHLAAAPVQIGTWLSSTERV